MILSLTPNPAVDQTIWVERLEPGRVHRVLDTHIDPAGKGINVSRMVHRLGWPTIAFGFVAGETGTMIEKALDQEEVPYHFVRIPGQTRVSVTVVGSGDQATSFFAPGPSITPAALDALSRLVRFWLQGGRVLVLAGSLPPGVPERTYADFIDAARAVGVKVILDADGAALHHGISAHPDLMKPNLAEAEALIGHHLADLDAILRTGRDLVRGGVGTVVISMGAEGAVCIQGGRAWRAIPPAIERRSTVGAGDAMVAGLAVALARGDDIEQGLRLGTAAGAAAAMSPGTGLGTMEDVALLLPGVQIEALA